MSYSASDSVSDSVAIQSSILPGYTDMGSIGEYDCTTVGSFTYCNPPPPTATTTDMASPSPSPSQGVTVTSVVSDIVYAISVILDTIAQAIAELAPYLISFIVAFSVMGRTYNAVRGVVMRFFGRYFRI